MRLRPPLWILVPLLLGRARAAPSLGADCVSGGAPLSSPPGLDDRDRFVFATTDASVHGFDADGRYRFTVTLNALPIGTLVHPDGRFFVVTADRRLRAYSGDGVEQWGLTLFDVPRGAPFWVGPGKLGVVGVRGELLVMSENGARLYSVRVGDTVGLPVASAGQLWFMTKTGDVRSVEGAWRSQLVEFDGSLRLVGPAFGGAILAQSGSDLLRISLTGREREFASVRFAESRGGYTGLVLSRPGGHDLALLDARGRTLARTQLLAEPLIPPAVGQGEVFAVLKDGRIQVLGPRGSRVLAGVSEQPRALLAGRKNLLALFGAQHVCVVR